MKLLRMNKPQCLLFSAAMILDVSPFILIKEIGHDGLDVWWPDYQDSRKYRAHSIEEIIDCCLKRNKTLTPIAALPMQAPEGGEPMPTYAFPTRRFEEIIKDRRAILIGTTSKGGGHAWAWDGVHAYDSRGTKSLEPDGNIRTAWVLFDTLM